MKAIWLITLLIVAMICVGCQAPVAQVTTPDPTMEVTAAPAATPTAEPPKVWDAKACEEWLEELIGQDASYDSDWTEVEAYRFKVGEDSYLVGYDGKIKGAMHGTGAGVVVIDGEPQQTLDLESAKELVYQEAMLYAPSFFEHEYMEECTAYEHSANIYLHQLSPHGNRTGNRIDAQVQGDGSKRSITIHNTEDIAVADQPVNIHEERAIELAYEAAEIYTQSLQEEWMENEPEDTDALEIYLDDREDHEIEVTRVVWRAKKIYQVDINHVATNKQVYTELGMDVWFMGFHMAIDAMSGEVIQIGHSR